MVDWPNIPIDDLLPTCGQFKNYKDGPLRMNKCRAQIGEGQDEGKEHAPIIRAVTGGWEQTNEGGVPSYPWGRLEVGGRMLCPGSRPLEEASGRQHRTYLERNGGSGFTVVRSPGVGFPGPGERWRSSWEQLSLGQC